MIKPISYVVLRPGFASFRICEGSYLPDGIVQETAEDTAALDYLERKFVGRGPRGQPAAAVHHRVVYTAGRGLAKFQYRKPHVDRRYRQIALNKRICEYLVEEAVKEHRPGRRYSALCGALQPVEHHLFERVGLLYVQFFYARHIGGRPLDYVGPQPYGPLFLPGEVSSQVPIAVYALLYCRYVSGLSCSLQNLVLRRLSSNYLRGHYVHTLICLCQYRGHLIASLRILRLLLYGVVEQRRPEECGAVRLIPGCDERKNRITDRVGFIEAVTCKVSYSLKGLFGRFGAVTVGHGPRNELASLLFHYLRLLLTHCFPKQVSLAQGITRYLPRDTHYMLLVYSDAVGVLSHLVYNGLYLFRIFRFDLSVFDRGGVLVCKPRIERSRPIQRHRRREVFYIRRTYPSKHVPHTRRGELEHSRSGPSVKQRHSRPSASCVKAVRLQGRVGELRYAVHSVSVGIIYKIFHCRSGRPFIPLSYLSRLYLYFFEHRQSGQPQYVQLHKLDIVYPVHIGHGDERTLHPSQRNIIVYTPGRYHQSGSMFAVVPYQTAELSRQFQDLVYLLFRQLRKLRAARLTVDFLLQDFRGYRSVPFRVYNPFKRLAQRVPLPRLAAENSGSVTYAHLPTAA